MTITIEQEAGKELDFDYQTLIRQVVEQALEYEECPYEAEVAVLLTDDAAIQEANREFRGIDRATDVLSFPMVEYEKPGEFSRLEDRADCFHPDTGELLLGDILLSTDHVWAQAEEYGHTRKRELAFLVAHSMLHLMGYDHLEETERIQMEERQEAILKELGITREVEP
ncbi:MAG: rRNA maturation RNase YbeY [Lachnospiraceae bacterium]|jgi:probable rRNA maturation factor|nr:rRNA maturation RNase YbeY [Lachnospiraceae bacterium]MCX4315500.1 rRNA maturation RNase YbeY [Lachnospiraceae bacterium]